MTGEWREIDVVPPLHRLPGDTYEFAAGVLKQYRAGILIAQRTLGAGLPFIPGPETQTGSLSKVYFFKEKRMPGQSAVLTNASRNLSTGAVTFDFSDGSSREYGGIVEATDAVKYLDTENDICKDALILKTLRVSPDGANIQNQVGSSFFADFTAAVPFVLTEAP